MQLNIKSIGSEFWNRPNLGLFIDCVFNNFSNLYDFPQLKHNKTEIRRLLMSTEFHGFIVFYGNKIIGYLLGEKIQYNNMSIFFINYIFIGKQFQNKKLGSQLLNYAKQYTKMENLQGIGLLNDTENEKNTFFYVKNGFEISEERLYQRHELYFWNN